MSLRTVVLSTLGVCAWVGCIAGGFAAMQRYASTPGQVSAPVTLSDATIAAHHKTGRGLVVMAVHPLCPCTEASLAELGDLLARSAGKCDALILEYRPHAPREDWPRLTTERLLGGVRVPVCADPDGAIAARLGALTSGHAVFVDVDGTTRFHGGLTLARGHRGRSPAQDAILALLAGKQPALKEAPVYGCSLSGSCQTQLCQ